MNYSISNEFGYLEDYDYLDNVIKIALKLEKVKNCMFEIIFVSNERIKNINKECRGIDKVTDVISFAFEDNEENKTIEFRFLGEIYICIPRMQEQASDYGHSQMRELSFLTVHGLLHLLGYDHIKKEDELIMFARQELILNEANIKR